MTTLIGPPIEVWEDPATGDVVIRNVNDPDAAIVATAEEWALFVAYIRERIAQELAAFARQQDARLSLDGFNALLSLAPAVVRRDWTFLGVTAPDAGQPR